MQLLLHKAVSQKVLNVRILIPVTDLELGMRAKIERIHERIDRVAQGDQVTIFDFDRFLCP